MLKLVSRGRLGTFRVYRYVRHAGFDCVGQTGGGTPPEHTLGLNK